MAHARRREIRLCSNSISLLSRLAHLNCIYDISRLSFCFSMYLICEIFTYCMIVICGLRVVNGTCYWPDGTIPEPQRYNQVPCNMTASGAHSACCEFGDLCAQNGFCWGGDGVMYRGSCTDPSWISDQCCQQCRDCIPHMLYSS